MFRYTGFYRIIGIVEEPMPTNPKAHKSQFKKALGFKQVVTHNGFGVHGVHFPSRGAQVETPNVFTAHIVHMLFDVSPNVSLRRIYRTIFFAKWLKMRRLPDRFRIKYSEREREREKEYISLCVYIYK